MEFSMKDPIFAIFISSLILIFGTVEYIRYSYGYWRRRKVPCIEPDFDYIRSTLLLPKGISIGAITMKFYEEFKKRRQDIGGVYLGLLPNLVLTNPKFIRDVLITDFKYFTDRGIYHCESDPISVNLVSQTGKEWRNARTKFSPIFTSIKIKQMFQTMLDSSKGLEVALDKLARQNADVDILEIAECFVTDVVGSCFLGIDCNSFKNPNAEFRQICLKFFTEFNFFDKLNLFMLMYFPNLSKKLGVRLVQKKISKFFFQSIQDTVNYREKTGVRRNDFLQLLIDLKNSEVSLNMNQLIAQVFIFFIGGFETSSTTITMTLFELSRNEEVQEKIRKEVREVLSKYDNKFTYDALNEMKYLEQAIEESLRIWPPVPNLTRVCVKDYKFNDTNIVAEKGIQVLIPTRSIHHDPEHWPDPERWDPARFNEENRKTQKPFTYLPFGDGPRSCIGLRFGFQQTKLAVATVLNRYRVMLSPETVTPLGINMEHTTLHTINTIYLNLEKIQ